MHPELTSSFELLERRLALMQTLAGSLAHAQSAVACSDLAGIEGRTAQQREICEALRQLEGERLRRSRVATAEKSLGRAIRMQPADAVSPRIQERWKALAQDLAEVEARVRQLNQVYGALLRRARRTVQIFNLVLASSANTYAPPKCEPVTAPSTFQEASHV